MAVDLSKNSSFTMIMNPFQLQ